MGNVFIVAFLLSFAQFAMAGNDPAIKGNLRKNIQAAMGQHINTNKLSGDYVIYDAINGETLLRNDRQTHQTSLGSTSLRVRIR